MRLTDGTKTVDIRIMRWDGTSYGPDWSADYFGHGGRLPYNKEVGAYIVEDVDYCIDMAAADNEDGACYMCNDEGDIVRDPNIVIFVEEVVADSVAISIHAPRGGSDGGMVKMTKAI